MKIQRTQRLAANGEVIFNRVYDLEELDNFIMSVFRIGATSVEVNYGKFHSVYEKVPEEEVTVENNQKTAGTIG